MGSEMRKHDFYPDPGYHLELRNGETTDEYLAGARGFSSVEEFREYYASGESRRAEIRHDRNHRDNRPESNEDLCRYAAFLRLTNE
jgi:hypothetical protein